jgi:hypothetical protein
LTDYLRPGELTVYAEKMPARLAAQMKFLKEPAPGHTAVVEVRKRFWDFPVSPRTLSWFPPFLSMRICWQPVTRVASKRQR